MTCPRGSCVGQNIPPGWFDQKNCCNARNQSYEWVVLHEGWRAQGRDAYEPCISKKEIYFCYYEFNGIFRGKLYNNYIQLNMNIFSNPS